MKKSILVSLAGVASLPSGWGKLVAWFPLDEGENSPTTFEEVVSSMILPEEDLSGYSADPELNLLTRGVAAPRGNLGSAYSFESGAGLRIGNSSAVQPSDQFTFSCWYQPQTLNPFDRLYESLDGNGNDINGMRIDTGGSGTSIRFLIRDGNGANTQGTHPLQMRNDGTWYFVALRYDSTAVDTPPAQLTVIEAADMIDTAGVSEATLSVATANTGPIPTPHALAETLIGLEREGNAGNGSNAGFDEVAFFDNSDGMGVLTDEQIAAVYNFGPSGVDLVTSFTSDFESVAPGGKATLSWEVASDFESIVLNDGTGTTTDLADETTDGKGSVEVELTESKKFTLEVRRGGARNAVTTRVLVTTVPVLENFKSDQPYVVTGGEVTLSWDAIAAPSLTLDPGDIDVSGMTSIKVNPTETTVFTLSAPADGGDVLTTTQVQVFPVAVPDHRYLASSEGNESLQWRDEIGTSNWNIATGLLNSPLAIPSANTSFTASYSTDGFDGAQVASFRGIDLTYEVWVRPGELSADYEAIFETGGGQNGLGILINETEIRCLGSAGDVRTVDLKIPVAGLVLDDFVQIIATVKGAEDTATLTVRDTSGEVRVADGMGDVLIGGNNAGLFGGGLANPINLGGRTEAPDADPQALRGFRGEIALLNSYPVALTKEQGDILFAEFATVSGNLGLQISGVDYRADSNSVELSWNSKAQRFYIVEFSTFLHQETWFELEDPFQIDTDGTSRVFALPPGQDRLFFRVQEVLAP